MLYASAFPTAFLFAFLANATLGQSINSSTDRSDVTLYESFLRQVASTNHPLSTGLYRPTPRDLIGLTEQEAQWLNAIAIDYESKNRTYDEIDRALRLEALFQSIESGQISPDLTRRRQDLSDEHARMVLDQMQKLRAALGDYRFQALEAFIRSNDSSSQLFPISGGPKPIKH